MHVKVRDGLARHSTHIDADVEAGRLVSPVEQHLAGVDQLEGGARSSAVESKYEAMCRRVMTSRWPGFTGYSSKRV